MDYFFYRHFFFRYLLPAFLIVSMFHSSITFSNTDELHFKLPKNFESTNPQLIQADEYFDAGLFSEAALLYSQSIEKKSEGKDSNNNDLTKQISIARFRLGQTYFALEKYQECISALRPNIVLFSKDDDDDLVKSHSLYLTALAYKNDQQYDQALETLSSYLKNYSHSGSFYDEAIFEQGLIQFILKNYDLAKPHFSQLDQCSKLRLRALSKMYLARIFMFQERHKEALIILTELAPQLSDELLKYELNYLLGEVSFQLHDHQNAIIYFEKALPKTSSRKCSWFNETLFYLGNSYLKMADNPQANFDMQARYLDKAEELFKQIIVLDFKTNQSPTKEQVVLALGQCYLTKAKRLKQTDAYMVAEELLSQQNLFQSPEIKAHAILLRAEAAPTYEARKILYQQLTDNQYRSSSFYPKGWYHRALNEFENGVNLAKINDSEKTQSFFKEAANSFNVAFNLFRDNDKAMAGASLKYQALAASYDNKNGYQTAFDIIDSLLNKNPELWMAMEFPDEVLYLHGFFAAKLAKISSDEYFNIAVNSLNAAAQYPSSKFGDTALLALAHLYFSTSNLTNAEKTYVRLINEFPSSNSCGEAWLWAAICSEKMEQDPSIAKERRRIAFENHASSPYADEAYFTYFTFQDYLQGDRQAIKHLQNLVDKFPQSIFLIEAQFLIGLDYKRDRKTVEGKWIRKKSLTEAIDAFQQVETIFDTLLDQELLSPDKLEYYTAVRFRATLERALTNLAIADESQGAKKQIYLEYAEELFKRMVTEFKTQDNIYTKLLFKESSFPTIFRESLFGLAQTLIKAQNDKGADEVLTEMIDLYKTNHVTRDYYLARAYYEKGCIAFRQSNYLTALSSLKEAEETAKGNLFSPDQKLELWIQQSLCYQGQNQYDNAILILSKAINDDAISALRLKAMYLRAETYEKQGRAELARKQLESLAKQKGPWALKAKNKLENEYGY